MNVVICIGHPDRSDDAVGPAVAERLAASHDVVFSAGDPGSLIEAWEDASWVVIVDAVKTDAPVGSLVVRELLDTGVFRGDVGCSSTHGLGLWEAIEIGRAVHCLPGRITLVGVASDVFRCGAAMSTEVEAAIDHAAQAVRSLLEPAPS